MTADRRTLTFALGIAGLCLCTRPVVAQDTTQVRTDSIAPDTTLSPPRPVVLPTPEPEVPRGPLPPGSRYTFTRDSLVWTNALTLSELLGNIPGVYIARGGFVGQSEYVVYGGRGARTVELFWDGIPMAPVGGDSVYVDGARIYLATLRRVDVEVLPATLRVYLVSERHERPEARSLVKVLSGDFASAQYTGLFQKRWPGGFGLGLAANFVGSEGFSGTGRNDHAFDVWGRFEWMPTPRAGAVYQIRRQNQDRDSIGTASDPGAPARHGTRTDAQFRIFAFTRPHGEGFGGELQLSSGGWGRDSVIGDRGVHHVGGTLRYTSARLGAEVTGRIGDRRVVRSVSARLGLSPLPGIVLAGDAEAEDLEGGRKGRRGHATVGLYRGPFSATGEIAYEERVQAPALRADTAVETVDQSVRAGFDTRLLSGSVSLVRRDSYVPLPFPDLSAVSALGPSLPSTFVVARVLFQPIRALTLDGWYSNPVRGRVDFQPPTHGRAQITFRSKFWRTFRSGAFDLKLQIAMESWSEGTAGLSSTGTPVALNGISFYEGFVSFQIVGFTAFYNLRNAYNAQEQYVPGLVYPRNAQIFGVRWEFFN